MAASGKNPTTNEGIRESQTVQGHFYENCLFPKVKFCSRSTVVREFAKACRQGTSRQLLIVVR
jgi:hypothetical protein